MTETLTYVHRSILPAAYALLPERMHHVRATAMLLAIGLQESRFQHRVQLPHGPAHGFWQFEKGGGVTGVLNHPKTMPIIDPILRTLRYPLTSSACYEAIVHNDVLAAVFARLLLWTVPGALPGPHEPFLAWRQYLSGWRPGKPHPQTWDTFYATAWHLVQPEEV